MAATLPRPLRWISEQAAMSRQVYREQGGRALLRAVLAKLRRGLRSPPPPASQAAPPAAAPASAPMAAVSAPPAAASAPPPRPWAYEGIEILKPIEVEVVDRDYPVPQGSPGLAVIVTVRNEAAGLPAFLESVAAQSLRPDEFIVVDGGSTDDTLAIARRFAARHPWMRVIAGGNVNIAAGRNLGVRTATAPHLIFVDAGCRLREHVFANLHGPFAERADLVGGVFDAARPSPVIECMVPDWRTFRGWDSFLPSARCLAVTRTLFEQVGGFPEYLTRTGEDTLFGVDCRRRSRRWVINTRARVVWDAPTTEKELWQLARHYAVGDGESGLGDYGQYGIRPGEPGNTTTLRGQQVLGYREGRARRPGIEVERRRIRGLVVLISGVPITDIGGGQRAAQLAMEFTRAGFKVTFLNLYPRYGDQVARLYFDIDHTLLELQAHADFDAEDYVARYGAFDVPCLVLTEFPHSAALPTLRTLRRGMRRMRYVFDYIDLWDSSLGGSWYDRGQEDELIGMADHLIASATTLQQSLAERAGREVHLVANAVNARLFRPDASLPRPRDLPAGGPVALYVGSLYGEWFDWAAVRAAADANPTVQFAFVGDHAGAPMAATLREQCANVHFLGPKAQRDLPGYLQHAAACLIPFRTDLSLTKFVNPLKVYEYLAMRKPVVATAMAELDAMPGVTLAKDAQGFAAAVRAAIGRPLDETAVAAFVAGNDWTARIARIAGICGV